MRLSTLALLAAGMFALAGCSDVTVYEPGVYKGASDPLVEDLRSEELKKDLQERVNRTADR
jgi:hypothetical protein